MQSSVVNYKTVTGNSDFRIDAEYYHPTSLCLHKKIKSKNGISFFNLIKSISSGKNLPQSKLGQYKFIRTQNIRPILIDDVGMSQTDNLESLEPTEEGELLFVRVGEGVGNSSVVTKCYSGNAISDNVLRLRIKGINPFFCSAFFNSKHGQDYFRRVFKGTARSLISQENFKDLLIPLFNDGFQKIIQYLIETSQTQVETSKHLYSQAEYELLSELGLLDWGRKHELTFVKNFSATQESERFDAEYFQPKYEDTIEAVRQCAGGFDELGDLVDIKKSVEPGREAYKNTGVPFVRVSNLSKFEISTNNQQYISDELYSTLKSHQPSQDEILLSKDATPGIAYHLNTSPQKMILSSGILRLQVVSPKVIPEYLTLLLNSVIVQEQIKRDSGGSIITHWRPDQVKAISVPVLGQDKQSAIKKSIEKSFDARHLSKKLLVVAKRGVEIAIEENEQEAEKWINSEVAELPI